MELLLQLLNLKRLQINKKTTLKSSRALSFQGPVILSFSLPVIKAQYKLLDLL